MLKTDCNELAYFYLYWQKLVMHVEPYSLLFKRIHTLSQTGLHSFTKVVIKNYCGCRWSQFPNKTFLLTARACTCK